MVRKKINNQFDIRGRVDQGIKPNVRGWVYVAGVDQATVSVKLTKGSEVRFVQPELPREDVVKAGLSDNLNCGYSVVFSDDNLSPVRAEVVLVRDCLSYTVPSYKGRDAFFIHIPKTAGSSVNNFFESTLGSKEFACHIEGKKDQWCTSLAEKSILTGHVTYDDYSTNLASQNRIVICFFRNPLKQLISHLNWVRHLSEKGNEAFFNNHPAAIQTMSLRMREFDWSVPDGLEKYKKSMTKLECSLFDNLQVRYLSRENMKRMADFSLVGQADLELARKRLVNIHLIGLSENTKGSLNMIAKAMGIASPKDEIHVNKNAFFYGLDAKVGWVADILCDFYRFDDALYESAFKLHEHQMALFGGQALSKILQN